MTGQHLGEAGKGYGFQLYAVHLHTTRAKLAPIPVAIYGGIV